MRLANWRLVNELIDMADVILELVDVRDPISTRSKKLEYMARKRGRPIIVVLNKADLVPRRICEAWKRYFNDKERMECVYISARGRRGTRVLRKTVKEVVDRTPLTIAIMGVPKVGKSTLINVLKGRHSAQTSPYPGTPGYTKKAQVYRIGGGIYLIDTPGLVPPEGGGIESIIRSTPIDSLKNPVKVALELIKKVLKRNPYAFQDAYGIETREPGEVLKQLALKRGWVYRKDQEPLLTEAAKAIIRDYLDGKIVYYTLPPQ
jgi:hypothetical protein